MINMDWIGFVKGFEIFSIIVSEVCTKKTCRDLLRKLYLNRIAELTSVDLNIRTMSALMPSASILCYLV